MDDDVNDDDHDDDDDNDDGDDTDEQRADFKASAGKMTSAVLRPSPRTRHS